MNSQKLFRALVVLVVCTLFAQSAFSQEAPRPAAAGRLVEFKLSSTSLKSNLLGDPAEQNVAVYLPPSYDASQAKRYPTLYLLHGFTDSIRVWTNNGYQGMSLRPLMDGLIKDGRIREMIVVVPNGRN